MLTLFLIAATCAVVSSAQPDSSYYADLWSRAINYLPTDRRTDVDADISPDVNSLLARLRGESTERLPVILNELSGVDHNQGNASISAQCVNDTLTTLAGLEEGHKWALRMLDAMGKPGSGILDGSVYWLGSYDECLRIVAVDNITQETLFNTRYCSISVVTSAAVKKATKNEGAAISPTLGMCVPEACGKSDLTLVMNALLQQMNLTVKLYAQTTCQERKLELDVKAVAAICVCVVFITLMVLGTAYDLYELQRKQTPRIAENDQKQFDEKTPLIHQRNEDTNINDLDSSMKDDSKEHYIKIPQSDVNGRNSAVWLKLLAAFSVYTNGTKILGTDQPTGSLTAVHGMRFITMTWVILGHSYIILLYSSGNVAPFLSESISQWTFHAILNALVSVDTFFTMSGLLVVYLVITEMKKTKGRINWVMFYFHRFWRLTPVYMFVIMLDVCLFRYVSDGPMWPQQGIELNNCRDTWWTNLLYINNLVKRKTMCFGWSWYLANDMQFYVISPLIIVPLFYRKLLGFAVLLFFLLVTTTTAGLITRLEGIPVGFFYRAQGATSLVNFSDYYDTPYCRMGPYLVGMAVGYILAKTNCKVTMNKVVSLGGWCLAAVAALGVLYGPYQSANGTLMTADVNAFYNAIHRTVWGMAVSWVIFACATGHGGIVNKLLSWKAFIPLSRLTYSAYLVHLLVLIAFSSSQRAAVYVNHFNVVYQFFGHLIGSYAVAFVVSLTFESPMMGLEKVLLKRERKN